MVYQQAAWGKHFLRCSRKFSSASDETMNKLLSISSVAVVVLFARNAEPYRFGQFGWYILD